VMQRACAATLLLFAMTHVAQGQNQIRGRVRDENNRPVSFAQVQMTPGDRRVVADGNGEFIIGSLATGDYELRIRRIGFEPTQVKVHVPSDEGWIPITMQSLPRVLDSVRIRERASSLRYTGIVIDDLDQPVVDAEVIAAGASDRGIRTDSDGHFRLLKAQKGTLVLRVRKFGYAPYFGSLTLQSEREDTIRMKRHATAFPRRTSAPKAALVGTLSHTSNWIQGCGGSSRQAVWCLERTWIDTRSWTCAWLSCGPRWRER
jgi:hypothetical protein